MGRGRGPNTADSYIGSLISLTSKSEIRYEGILYTVDTENSNIALQNVRSYGTEGRKKDGPQIPASDKVYDYIIFRGSDIKDLQVKSSPPPPLQPPPPSQPTDPAIISLQSQSQYPPPSSYNGGGPAAAGSTSEPSAPPLPPYVGMPPSQYQVPGPPLYPPVGLQSWGPPPPPPGANGSGMAMPMYWQGYYRPPPAGHMQQHQPMPPRPPPSLAAPPQGHQHPHQQAPQAPSLPPQLPAVSLPPGGPNSIAAAADLASQPQVESFSSGVQAASVASSVSPVAPLMTATATPASTAGSSSVSAVSTSASSIASSIGTTAVSGAPVSATSSLPSSIQGVSAVITPMRSDPRRSVGMVSQGLQASSLLLGGSSSQGLRTQNISSGLIRPQSEAAQSSGMVGMSTKAGVSAAHQQAPQKVEQKSATSATSSQGAPAQEQVRQPLLPLPSAEQTQQTMAQQRGGQGMPIGQRSRWQGNGYTGNGNYNRRGRGRGGRGRGTGLANPTRQFTEDFDFTAMNEKFNKDEVWGALGGKGKNVPDEEEYDCDDGPVEEDVPNPAESDASKKVLYKKNDFFDSLSCDAFDRGGGRGERTKFSEQRKIDTETFGAFPVRSRGGRGGHRGGYRGGYYGGGGGSYGIGRGSGYGRGGGSGRPSSAII